MQMEILTRRYWEACQMLRAGMAKPTPVLFLKTQAQWHKGTPLGARCEALLREVGA